MLKCGREKNDYNQIIIFNEEITLQSESLNHDLINIQVTGCCYRQTLERVAISRPFVSLSRFYWGGGPKSILFSLFWNKKASFEGIYTFNGVQI